jgi:hypothetical protein
MGGVKRRDREARPTSEFDSSELAALTRKQPADDEVEFTDLMDELDPPTVRIAAGTTPPASELPLRSRTTTAYDPLTTSLLAEVTRTQTVDELEAPELEPDAKPAPVASPRLIRRG